MTKIGIDDKFKSIIPPLSVDEYKLLEENIQKEGCREPLLIWNNTIVDGHNRYEICTKHNIPFETTPIEFDTREDAIVWIIKNQLGRRNLTPLARIELVRHLEPIIEAKAKENQGTRTDICQNSDKSLSPVDTKKEMAKLAGVSHDTYTRGKKILEEAPEEQKEQLKRGETSINAVYKEITDKPHVLHNSGNNEWYTPVEYILSAKKLMGGIDLDPASSELANSVVGAKQIYTIEDNGLNKEWHGRIWLNPPYERDLIIPFVNKFVEEFNKGNIQQAMVLVNNATETNWFQSLANTASAICFVRGRIKYWCPDGKFGSPLQGQVIIYCGDKPLEFGMIFSKHGLIAQPVVYFD